MISLFPRFLSHGLNLQMATRATVGDAQRLEAQNRGGLGPRPIVSLGTVKRGQPIAWERKVVVVSS